MRKDIEKLVEYSQQKFITCSLDKLTILGDDTGNFETMINNNNFGFIERSGMAKHPYKRWFPCVDGSNIQWTDMANFKAIRYEFNPNNVKLSKEREHQRAIADIIKTMKYPKISRYDVAFDFYGYDLSTYKIVDKVGRKKNYWVDRSDTLETLYVGSPTADMRIRIYNKAKEQKIEFPLDWWRVELQFRDEACSSVQGFVHMKEGTMTVPAFIPNLLDSLRVYKPNYAQMDNVQEIAMVKLLLEEPDYIKQLSKNSRAKYKKILSNLPNEEEIDLQNLFISHHDKILKTIQDYLLIAERNNVLDKPKKDDKRTQEQLENTIIEHDDDYYTKDESEFLLESAKIHLLYNT